MDPGAATTPKRPRPILRRSQTASPEVSPPHVSHRGGGVTSQAARKLHLHTRHSPKDRIDGDAQKLRSGHHSQHHAHKSHQSPGRAIVETAKQALPGSGSGSHSRDIASHDAKGRRLVRPEDVERERQRQQLREEELRTSLGSLTQLANSMTRQLDSIYYAILEKASLLRVAVDNLQKLSGESIELRQTFEADANGIKSKVQGQIDEFGGLTGQEKTIAEMEGRVKAGTQRAHALSDRLEQARKRVEQWEKREAEWQARTSGRIRASIISVSCVLAGVLFLLILKWVYFNRDSLGGAASIKAQLDNTLEAFSIPFHLSRPARPRPTVAMPTMPEDPRLRIFDEL